MSALEWTKISGFAIVLGGLVDSTYRKKTYECEKNHNFNLCISYWNRGGFPTCHVSFAGMEKNYHMEQAAILSIPGFMFSGMPKNTHHSCLEVMFMLMKSI